MAKFIIGVMFVFILFGFHSVFAVTEVAVGDEGDGNGFAFTAKFDCKAEEVGVSYGKKFVIFVDGIDVCSWEYARSCGFSKPRKPVYQDLSDKSGWPNIHVKSGTLAIDPVSGRFKFAEGDIASSLKRAHFVMTPHGMAHVPVIRGRIMYCPNGETWSGLRVVNISDPSSPKDLTTRDVGCFGRDAVGLDNRLYCVANYYGVTILDITVPESPKKIGHWRVPAPSVHSSVVPFKLNGKEYFYCFVNSEGDWKDWPRNPAEPAPGLRLVDATDPANPVSVNLALDFMFVAVHGNYGYQVAKEAVNIYDISKPETPKHVGAIPGKLGRLVFSEKRLFASDGSSFVVFDNANPAEPKQIGKYDGLNDIRGIAVNGNYAYVTAEGDKFIVLDISSLAEIKKLGDVTCPRTKSCNGVALTPDGKVAAVSDGGEGFGQWLFDVSDPAKPRKAGEYFSAGEIQHLLVSGSRATASLEWAGVQAMLDVADPLKMKITGYYHSGKFDDYADVFRGNSIYFGKGRKDAVIDVTDPANPREIGSYETEENQYFPVRFWENTGYTIGELNGKSVLTIYDYSDDRNPKKISRIDLGNPQNNRCHALATDGKTLAGLGKNCLIVVDVLNPADPKITGRLDSADIDSNGYYAWQGSGRRIGIKGGLAYIIKGSEGADDPRIAVYDISDPQTIKQLYVTPESKPTFQDDWFDSRILHQGDMFNDLIIEGRYMYVSDYWGGVRVYDIVDPKKPVCVDFEFDPYYELVPGNWNREEYKKAVQSGDVHKYFNITPEKWEKRFEIGRKLSWTDFVYYPGYELFAWNIGELVGDYLCQPKLGGVAVYKVKRSPEKPTGKVSVAYY